tara:strand:- start:21770 stop:22531 length:762 start_codon:yes stop_codon:yes gene_type:complete
MNRLKAIKHIRNKIKNNKPSIGSFMQIPNSSVAEIMGQSGYDWIAIDLEHGSFSPELLPDICRALELGKTLPLARLAKSDEVSCKLALDAGVGGVILPLIEDADQLNVIIDACRWPPSGKRGVGYSRANLYGKNFDKYKNEAQKPLIIAMIETIIAVDNLEKILSVKGLDAIFVGPYDLSASMGKTGQFGDKEFIEVNKKILSLSKKYRIAPGIHVIEPSINFLKNRIKDGYLFNAYSLDTVMLSQICSFKIS